MMSEKIASMNCPACGEPVKPNWKICPACETRLDALTCPQCSRPVKENWKRCPECEAQLVCTACQMRLPRGSTHCPQCAAPAKVDAVVGGLAFKDTVCGIEWVFVKGGAFDMGDTFDVGISNEVPVHKVVLKDFYMARHPVTQAQWLRLMPVNPSRFDHPDQPVEQVSWTDAVEFARKLTDAHDGARLFRLPTEAQWEYAARSGGRRELYAGGDQIEALAWYESNSHGRPQPVGTKKPNGLGLCDMSGNVWEWCLDTFGEDAYQRHAPTDPLYNGSGPDRVIRGGSWNLDAWSARCARRFNFTADFFGPALGFRLVMLPAAGSDRG